MTWLERTAVATAFGYLAALGWAMQHIQYDLWGALVTAPILVVITIPIINRTFAGHLAPLRPVLWLGFAAKLAGAIAGYFVRADLYGGLADANRYHASGAALAESLRSGDLSLLTQLFVDRGTFLTEDVTGVVYSVFGSSKLGGFFVFAWMSYLGLAFTLRAGITAVPALARKRYALLLFLTPTLVYWGSSIGKEAIVGLTLGVTSLGIAITIADSDRRLTGLGLTAIGVATTAMVRPHFAAVWVGAAGIALAVRLVANLVRRDGGAAATGSRLGALLMLGLAGAGFLLVSTLTLSYLDPNEQVADGDETVTDRIAQIFDTTEDRTSTGGSSLELVSTGNPLDYPYAAFRTLTRPLVFEASGLSQLLPALETTALLLIAARWWRRFANVPTLARRNPYVVYALVCVVTFGVAFASIGNLGILVRQRSLVFPLLLLFWCLPERVAKVQPATPSVPLRRTQPASTS